MEAWRPDRLTSGTDSSANGRWLTCKNTVLIALERPLSAQPANSPPSLHPTILPLQGTLS